jgi:hypothetical protein
MTDETYYRWNCKMYQKDCLVHNTNNVFSMSLAEVFTNIWCLRQGLPGQLLDVRRTHLYFVGCNSLSRTVISPFISGMNNNGVFILPV